MKPEEFTAALRANVQRDLKRHAKFVQQAISDHGELNEKKLIAFTNDPGGALAQAGLAPKQSVAQINRLVLAIYSSRHVADYLETAAHAINKDPKLRATLEAFGQAPDKVPDAQIGAALDRLLADDTFFTQPIRMVLEDDGIRTAMGVPPELTFEVYIQRLRKAIRDAKSLDEIAKVSNLGNPAMLLIPVAVLALVAVAVLVGVALGAVAYLAVLAHSYAAAYHTAVLWTKVKVFSAVAGVPGMWESAAPGLGSPLTSICVNQTSQPLWMVVETGGGLRRLSLPPGRGSVGIGVRRVEAILIGGRSNALQSLATASDGRQSHGAYVLACDEVTPAAIIVGEGPEGPFAECNKTQADAVAAGRAGWSDLAGHGSAGTHFDGRYSTDRLAAAAPAAMDIAKVTSEVREADRFYRTLQIERFARLIQRSIPDAS